MKASAGGSLQVEHAPPAQRFRALPHTYLTYIRFVHLSALPIEQNEATLAGYLAATVKQSATDKKRQQSIGGRDVRAYMSIPSRLT